MEERQDHATRTISIVMIIALVGRCWGCTGTICWRFTTGRGWRLTPSIQPAGSPGCFLTRCSPPLSRPALSRCSASISPGRGGSRPSRFAGCFITVMGLLSAVLSVLGILFAGPLVSLFADGYDAQTAELAVSLTRVMFPGAVHRGGLLLCGSAPVPGGVQCPCPDQRGVQPGHHSLLPDAGPAVRHLRPGRCLLVGWFLQAAVQVPSLRRLGFRYRPGLEPRSEGMRKVFALMLPVMVSTWVQPINLTINSKFGSRLYEGAGVSAIEFSTNLYLVIAGCSSCPSPM